MATHQSESHSLNMLLGEKSGIDSRGFQTIQVVGANNADEAANNISQYKLNYDPNPIVIRKTDPRGPVQYKQKVYVRYLQPPAAPEPGPIIIQEKRPPPAQPLPPLIVRQRAPRQKTPPPIILREMPPEQQRAYGGPRYVDVTNQYNAGSNAAPANRKKSKSRPSSHAAAFDNYNNMESSVTHNHRSNAVDDMWLRQVLGKDYGRLSQGKWITEVVKN